MPGVSTLAAADRLNAMNFWGRYEIYNDIGTATTARVIGKLGNPSGYDVTYYNTPNAFPAGINGRRIYCYGSTNQADGHGAWVDVPSWATVLWLRVLGERWNTVKAYSIDQNGNKLQDFGYFGGGYSNMRKMHPAGAVASEYGSSSHEWVPVFLGPAADGVRRVALIAQLGTNSGFFLSGVGYSENPSGLSYVSAYVANMNLDAYIGTRGTAGSAGVVFNNQSWNGDILMHVEAGASATFGVPLYRCPLPSAGPEQDQYLYLLDIADDVDHSMPRVVTVNDVVVTQPQDIDRGTQPRWRLLDTPVAWLYRKTLRMRAWHLRVPAAVLARGEPYRAKVRFDEVGNRTHFRGCGFVPCVAEL